MIEKFEPAKFLLTEEQRAKIMESMKEETSKRMAEFEETLKRTVKKISSAGWTLPMTMAIYPINYISNLNTDMEVDLFIVEYFTVDKNRNLLELLSEIESSTIEDRIKKVINECIIAFNNGLYSIAVNSLVSVVEGLLANFDDDKTNIRMMKVCRYEMDRITDKDQLIQKYCWESYLNFITRLYEKSAFDKDEPSFVNRHWLLHGRSSYDVNESDCIRLFNAVATICCLYEKRGVKEKEKNE